MDENRSLIDKVVGATEEAVSRVQQEVANRQVVNATRERATAMRTKAQQAALSQLQLAKGGSAVAARAKRVDAILVRYRPQIAAAGAPGHLLRLDKRRLLGDIDGLRRKLQPLESGTKTSSKSMTEAEQLTEMVGDIGVKCEPT
jgi:hypothetical protein